MEEIFKSLLNERIENYGIKTLHNEEILAALTGAKISILKEFIDKYSLYELIVYLDTLKISKAQKRKLSLLFEFVKRVSASKYREKPVLDSSTRSGDFFINDLKFYKNEVFKVAMLDAQNRLITLETISEGVVNEAHVYPRVVIKSALDFDAISVILAHNHPGGSLSPSKSDIECTKTLQTALRSMGIKLVDHIIVAEGKYSSMAEKNLLF